MSGQSLNISLTTKLSQKLLITPQMKQSLSLLQMPIADLVQEISTYLEENPVLEVQDFEETNTSPEEQPEHEQSGDDNIDNILEAINTPEWENYIDENGEELKYTPVSDEDKPDFESFVESSLTLCEHLLTQLKVAHLPLDKELIGEAIIGNLSEDGYFRVNIDEFASSIQAEAGDVDDVLAVIKTFDPAGIASSTLCECILAQLPAVGASEGEVLQIRELINECSCEISSFKYEEIEKKLGLDRENIEDLMYYIRKTDPKPGLSFANSAGNHITPDVYITRSEDEYFVHLNESGIPALQLSNYYTHALKQSVDKDTKDYLEDKIKSAIWVIKSLQKRQKAIYKVTKAIVDIQKDYLKYGESYLKPLRLKDIADITELHESTVSRVTSGKYALSERGMVELKSFFSKGVDSGTGEDISTRKVKTLIKSMVDSEPAEKPHSDEKIAKALAEEGIDIARRTVAKYRDEMNIPTMSQRKKMRR